MQIEKSQVIPLPLHYLKHFFCLIDKFNLMAIFEFHLSSSF
jgi:hypothetical protein